MNDINKIINEEEQNLKDIFEDIDKQEYLNSKKIIDAFKKENILESDFNMTTGYGYGDIGRDKIEKVYADIMHCEDALVRSQIISGSHALTVALFGILRPNDKMLCISGRPYDTLLEVIGINENKSSLISFGIKYDEIDLLDNDFDYKTIEDKINNDNIKVIYIQRSKGYSLRKSICIEKIEKVIKLIKNINKNIIILVDNCYTEFVEDKFPTEVGADLIVGSLIKNLGGGITLNGGYIAGKKDLVYLASERLNLPGEAKEVGPSLGHNKDILMGLYHAPHAVSSSLKIAVLTSKVMEKLGYEVEPKYNEKRCDIVQSIIFNNEKNLINYTKGIQFGSAIDNNTILEPTDMPGYDDKIIMASGSFIQGSSIEISCDGPIREPYVAYQQGGLTYSYGKIALINAIENLK